MINNTQDSDYTLLALLLAPAKDNDTINAIKSAISNNRIIWVNLIKEAGEQRCTPLLYVRLNQHDLFSEFPKPIQNIISSAYNNNRQRNKTLKAALIKLLNEFEQHQIESLLLKGAATFCDNLYSDPGARVMGDLDILVYPKDVATCKYLLEKQGYIVPDPGMAFDGLATDVRHHQIPAYRHPDTQVIIEIHFNVSYGQAGRTIPTEQAWQSRIKTQLSGYKTSVLSEQDKIILNTAHALLPKREFIRGEISLLQLADLTVLMAQYQNKINWDAWANTAKEHRLTTEFMTYLLMSHELMQTPWPFSSAVPNRVRVNYLRIKTIDNKEKQPITTLYQHAYYYLRLPAWVWNNVCYAPGIKNFPSRIILLVKKLFKPRSWSKI